MPIELFNDGEHLRLMFTHLTTDDGQAVQSNQFLFMNGKSAAILDPGGNLAYNELYMGLTQHCPPHQLGTILASHADPDIIASLDRWMTASPAQVYISTVWERFIPHLCKPGKTAGRIVGIPDAGLRIPLGKGALYALPAHFLHAEGNFQFWDPVSHILFSGDLAASIGADARTEVSSLKGHLQYMEAFHRRYMVSNKVLRLWANMVAPLDIRKIVPQHGSPLVGAAVREFIDWVQTLQCGVDLMTDRHYTVPT
jgi:flavorubredoxin